MSKNNNKRTTCYVCGHGLLDFYMNGVFMYQECPNCHKRYEDSKSIQRVGALPSDVKSVVINNTTVIVYLCDGRKGKANCGYMDTFDPYVGFVLAYHRCKHNKNFELKNVLKSCIDSAQRKGYKQAILKNYDK